MSEANLFIKILLGKRDGKNKTARRLKIEGFPGDRVVVVCFVNNSAEAERLALQVNDEICHGKSPTIEGALSGCMACIVEMSENLYAKERSPG